MRPTNFRNTQSSFKKYNFIKIQWFLRKIKYRNTQWSWQLSRKIHLNFLRTLANSGNSANSGVSKECLTSIILVIQEDQ